MSSNAKACDAGANIIIAGRNKTKNTLSNKLKSNIEAMAIEVDVDDELSCQIWLIKL